MGTRYQILSRDYDDKTYVASYQSNWLMPFLFMFIVHRFKYDLVDVCWRAK